LAIGPTNGHRSCQLEEGEASIRRRVAGSWIATYLYKDVDRFVKDFLFAKSLGKRLWGISAGKIWRSARAPQLNQLHRTQYQPGSGLLEALKCFRSSKVSWSPTRDQIITYLGKRLPAWRSCGKRSERNPHFTKLDSALCSSGWSDRCNLHRLIHLSLI
jgi:hypothetical protein